MSEVARLKTKPRLRLVAEPAPDTSYESEQRNRIMSRDWAAVHIAADRRPAFATVFGGRR